MHFKKFTLLTLSILLFYFWFVGIEVDVSQINMAEYLSKKEHKLLVVFYDNCYSYCCLQSVDKWGIQRTMYVNYCRDSIQSVDGNDFFDSLGDISKCTINLVKPWYYLKTCFYTKHQQNSLAHESSIIFDAHNYFSGFLLCNGITSEKNLYPVYHMGDYRNAILWKNIINNSGISKYIKNEIYAFNYIPICLIP